MSESNQKWPKIPGWFTIFTAVFVRNKGEMMYSEPTTPTELEAELRSLKNLCDRKGWNFAVAVVNAQSEPQQKHRRRGICVLTSNRACSQRPMGTAAD